MLSKKKKEPIKSKQQQKKSIIQLNYEKIKQKQFEIFISDHVLPKKSMFMSFNSLKDLQYDSSYVKINNGQSELQQGFIDQIVKCFASIYHIDYIQLKQFESKVFNLLKNCNQMIKLIQKFKKQRKIFEQNKNQYDTKINQYESLKKKYHLTQINTNQQIQTQRNQSDEKTKNYQQRIKNIEEKRKELNKIIQSQSQKIDQLKIENLSLKKENGSLKEKINQLLEKIEEKLNINEDHLLKIQKNEQIKPFQLNNKKYSLFENAFLENNQNIWILLSFLRPDSLTSILSLRKPIRACILNSSKNVSSIFKLILRSKYYQINRLRCHIEYFEQSLHKIPEQLIKWAYYKSNILKEPIGGNFLQILKLCGSIFEGKIAYFSQLSHNKQTQTHNRVVKQYIQSKSIESHINFLNSKDQQQLCLNNNPLQLSIDHSIIIHFQQQKKSYKQHTIQQIQSMYKKLIMNEQIYKVDRQILKEFYCNLIRNFTILFVLSRDLFTEARGLQQLNCFLLAKLNGMNKYQIDKKYDLQDLKAELASERRLKEFLSGKCQKIQEKYLKMNKQNIQLKLIIKSFEEKIKTKDVILQKGQSELDKKSKENEELAKKNKQIKKIYQQNRQKYNDLIKELSIVKKLTKKMNFLSE